MSLNSIVRKMKFQRVINKLFILIGLVGTNFYSVSAQQNEKLWYKQPAKEWTEALPVGNGRLGAMIFGKVNEELIQLNESTLWSGGPVPKSINPDAPKFLPQIRDVLLNEEDYEKAEPLVKKMQGLYTESYMPLGDLLIKQKFKDTVASSYYRDLNLKNAVSTTRFTIDGTEFTRQVFSSAPDQVIVIRLSANKPGQLNFTVSTKSLLHYQLSVKGKNELIMKGRAPSHADPSYYNKNKIPVLWNDTTGNHCSGMRYELIVKALNKDGTIAADTSGLQISNATEVVLFLSAATSFNGFDKCPDKDGKDEDKIARGYLDKAIKKSYTALFNTHLLDYKKFYDRVSLELKDTTGKEERIAQR